MGFPCWRSGGRWLGILALLAQLGTPVRAADPVSDRLRVIVETDAGGDPDDEQSLVRFLLHCSAWDVEALIANRPRARDGENRNPERTGLGIVQRLVRAYGEVWPRLVLHDPGFPPPARLLERTVSGIHTTDAAVERLIAAADAPDARPIWYADWGSDHGSATNNLRRALDRVRRERGPEGYARFKARWRLSSSDAFGPHTFEIEPAFPLWVDTWRPELEGRRWYHRFSALTATAGGFDVVRDVLTGHGPLGALYPTNTTHWAKEGDSLSFLYLFPVGLGDPERPQWGGWGGRLGPREGAGKRAYFWANQADHWNGSTHRDHTLARWAADLQQEFRARLDWCVRPPAEANHPPVARLDGPTARVVTAGQSLVISAGASTDPDGDPLSFEWFPYPEPGTWRGDVTWRADGSRLEVVVPEVRSPETLHFVVRVVDGGSPPLARYQRVVLTAVPALRRHSAGNGAGVDASIWYRPSTATAEEGRRPLLRFADGRDVRQAADWAERRRELLQYWRETMGRWPAPLERPGWEERGSEPFEGGELRRVRVELAAGQWFDAWFAVPAGKGPFPAVFVPYYEPETSIGRGQPLRDFGRQLMRRGMATLSIGSPGGDARRPDLAGASLQPLAYLAYLASNAATALGQRAEVDAQRLGIVGHSYGGKWALFAAAFDDRFRCSAWSDPGIAWDETRPNINYWEPWYLGAEPGVAEGVSLRRSEGSIDRRGAYARLRADGADLQEIHALVAPRPFLVSGGAEDPPERWTTLAPVLRVYDLLEASQRVGCTSRAGHDPTPESNRAVVEFFVEFLGGTPAVATESP